MYQFLSRVRCELGHLSREIFGRLPLSRVGLLGYGDYCDAATTYVTKSLDFTSDTSEVTQFTENLLQTHGGDFPEAVEEALFVANQMSWRLGSRRAIALIGDAPPHGVIDSVTNCKHGHFWRQEVHKLQQKGIRLYSIQCGQHQETKRVFQKMSAITGGVYLRLDNINDLVDLLIGICMEETGLLRSFQERLQRSQRLTASKQDLLRCLGEGSGNRWLP